IFLGQLGLDVGPTKPDAGPAPAQQVAQRPARGMNGQPGVPGSDAASTFAAQRQGTAQGAFQVAFAEFAEQLAQGRFLLSENGFADARSPRNGIGHPPGPDSGQSPEPEQLAQSHQATASARDHVAGDGIQGTASRRPRSLRADAFG